MRSVLQNRFVCPGFTLTFARDPWWILFQLVSIFGQGLRREVVMEATWFGCILPILLNGRVESHSYRANEAEIFWARGILNWELLNIIHACFREAWGKLGLEHGILMLAQLGLVCARMRVTVPVAGLTRGALNLAHRRVVRMQILTSAVICI